MRKKWKPRDAHQQPPPPRLVRAFIAKKTRTQLLHSLHDPHNFQLDAAVRIAEGKDTILIAPTGSGKTLVLPMPLTYHDKKISLVISPLHALETDQVKKMNAMEMHSLLVDSVELSNSTIKVCSTLWPHAAFHLTVTFLHVGYSGREIPIDLHISRAS